MKKIILLLLSFLCINVCRAQSTTGEISSNAITLQVNEADDFHEGYAIVRKGEAFGIINKYGNFLIPYGKYIFSMPGGFKIDKQVFGFSEGLCAVRDIESEKYGFIDSKGKLIVPCTLSDVSRYLKDGYAWAKEKNRRKLF